MTARKLGQRVQHSLNNRRWFASYYSNAALLAWKGWLFRYQRENMKLRVGKSTPAAISRAEAYNGPHHYDASVMQDIYMYKRQRDRHGVTVQGSS